MNKLQLPQSKLLYAVGQAYRKRMIDETQKRMLKQKIITDNVQIFEVLERNENQADLFEQLVAMVRVQEDEPQPQLEQPVNPATVDPQSDQPSSPWGEFLRRKKMNRQLQQRNDNRETKNLIKPEKAN